MYTLDPEKKISCLFRRSKSLQNILFNMPIQFSFDVSMSIPANQRWGIDNGEMLMGEGGYYCFPISLTSHQKFRRSKINF